MNRYILRAKGKELDTYEDLGISLNYQIQDILDPTKTKTSFSKTITLPGTSVNNLFFKQIFDVNIDNRNFNPALSVPVNISVGDNEVFNGIMQLVDIIVLDKTIEYDIICSGELKSLFTAAGEMSIRDVGYSDLNHIRNIDWIKGSWDNNIFGKGYFYPYIVYGTTTTDVATHAYASDLFPAVYDKEIVDRVFRYLGYTYNSTFFETDAFKKCFLAYNGEPLQLPPTEITKRSITTGLNENVSLTSYIKNGSSDVFTRNIKYLRESGTVDDSGSELTFSDTSGLWSNGRTFTCGKTGRYNVSFTGQLALKFEHIYENDIQHSSGAIYTENKLLLIRKNGSVTLLDSGISDSYPNGWIPMSPTAGEYTSPWLDIAGAQTVNLAKDNIYLEQGDKIELQFGLRYVNVKWVGILNDNNIECAAWLLQSKDSSFSKLIVEPASNVAMAGEIVDMNQVVSDITIKDYLLDLIKTFNLVFMPDPNKPNNIIIEPFDVYFGSKPRVVDWTYKLDESKEVRMKPMSELDARKYVFTYTPDNDYYNELYTQETGRLFGDYYLDVENDFSTDIKEFKVKYSPTVNTDAYTRDRVAPYFVTGDGETLKPKVVKLRRLYFGGLKSCRTWYLKNDYNATTSYTLTSYPYCGMWDDPKSPTYDLSFGFPDKLYWKTSKITTNNLYERYHKTRLNNITNYQSRIMEAYIYLTPKDIAEFDFRDVILINGSYWRVNQIKDFDPLSAGPTKVVLYKLVDIVINNPLEVELPVSNKSCPVDLQIRFDKNKSKYYTSASGSEITEDCCNSLNGTFKNGVCYLNVINVAGPDTPGPTEGPTGGPRVKAPKTPTSLERYKIEQNGNTVERLDVIVRGRGNIVDETASVGLIIGDNNHISEGATNFVVIGENITVDESDSVYIGGVKIDSDGNITQTTQSGVTIIDGGLDEVFNYGRTNFIDIIDGGLDAVREFTGDSKERPIIDGNMPEQNVQEDI